MEGGRHMAETIRFLVDRGIPVMGHIGLTPQAVNTLGGFKAQGRDPEQWAAIEADARAVADAGAFSIVVEAVAEPLAAKITREVAPPTIGIGGSPECDGQILVLEDMLGLSPKPPRFVRPYGRLADHIREAVGAYAADVRSRTFPALENTYPMRKVRQA
jgi:3-methyl-2-oxobutanoate hydroxymethyltransferase